MIDKEKELLNGHPYIYMYVKSLAERHLERYGKKHRLVINRPSMIVHCAKEPFIGWTDTVSAVGTISFPMGMGMLKTFYLPNGARDIITADTVSNAILVSSAYIGQKPEPCFQIYHNTSTVCNPIKWHDFFKSGSEYLKLTPHERQVREPAFRLYTSRQRAERR